MKFWTWGDSQGLAADPNDFEQEERPYIELWSGISNEFFQSVNVDANASISFTETYWPTVDIPTVTYMNEAIAFGSSQNESQVDLYAYQPVGSDDSYEIEFRVLDNSDTEVYNAMESVSVDLLLSTKISIDIETINLESASRLEATLTRNGTVVWTDVYEYVISSLEEPIIASFEPQLSVENNQLKLVFEGNRPREVHLFDTMGKQINRLSTQQTSATLDYSGAGIYIIHVIENNRRWTKKVAIRD